MSKDEIRALARWANRVGTSTFRRYRIKRIVPLTPTYARFIVDDLQDNCDREVYA